SEDTLAEGKLEDVIILSGELLTRILPESAGTDAETSVKTAQSQSAFENYIRGLLSQDPQKQISYLETAVRLDPGYTAASLELGFVYQLERDFTNSNKWLAQVTKLGPEQSRAQFMIGLNYFYLGDYARSVATFQQLPKTYDVLLDLGAAESQKGDFADAVAV